MLAGGWECGPRRQSATAGCVQAMRSELSTPQSLTTPATPHLGGPQVRGVQPLRAVQRAPGGGRGQAAARRRARELAASERQHAAARQQGSKLLCTAAAAGSARRLTARPAAAPRRCRPERWPGGHASACGGGATRGLGRHAALFSGQGALRSRMRQRSGGGLQTAVPQAPPSLVGQLVAPHVAPHILLLQPARQACGVRNKGQWAAVRAPAET